MMWRLMYIAVWLTVLVTFSTQYKSDLKDYVKYEIGGDMSHIVISAPHGGTSKNSTYPDRPQNGCYDDTSDTCTYSHGVTCDSASDRSECGVKSRFSDQNTRSLATHLANSLRRLYGGSDAYRPHVIKCNLHRSKVDANRAREEATFGDSAATAVWEQYHRYINASKAAASSGSHNVLYIDIHGQSASSDNMVGLLLPRSGSRGLTNTVLPDSLAGGSSITQLQATSGQSLEELVRGPTSIGGLMESNFTMLPSPNKMNAGDSAYFSGGYSLKSHTGGHISGFQMEVTRDIRLSSGQRADFAAKLADAVKFWADNYLQTTN